MDKIPDFKCTSVHYIRGNGTVKKRSPHPESVLTNIICIEKALKGD